MRDAIDFLVCRLLGRRCSVRRPASRDLVRDMRDHARKAEAEAVEIRKEREGFAALRPGVRR